MSYHAIATKMKTPHLAKAGSVGQRLQTLAYLSEQGQVSELFELTFDRSPFHINSTCL